MEPYISERPVKIVGVSRSERPVLHIDKQANRNGREMKSERDSEWQNFTSTHLQGCHAILHGFNSFH